MHIHREVGSLVRPPRSEASSLLEEWRRFIAKEKAVVAMLNRFEGDVTLRAGCWFPTAELETIQQRLALQASRLHASAFLASDGKPITHATGGDADPPSFIKRNEFTWAFQELVDTYGTCRYQEANPGVLTCVTFPFLFGIMYGDIGHGSILLAFGIYLMLNSKSLKQQGGAMADMAAARYMLTMMGAFAVYAGFMYNEFMAIGINLFGSQWTTDPKNPEDMFRKGGPYVFGLDPAWKGATNELVFLNSFKMKFSVIVGVAQMTVGVFLKGGNTLHARSVLDFVFEFLPQITFMTCLFGYMDFLIVYKWLQSTDDPNAKFPALIQSMINMVLVKPVDPENQLIPNQGAIQSWLLLAAVCAVPIMLFPKPIILLIAHSVKQRGERGGGRREPRGEGDEGGGAYHRLEEGAAGGGARVHPEAPSAASGGPRGGAVGAHVTAHGGEGGEVVGGEHGEEGEEFEFGEIFIHQVIETIEFVLGTVSNTASYLRLWALSLAHQQLSLVFFDKCVGAAMSMPDSILKPLAIYVAFAIFMAITFGVLLCMDVLECFLHALRLQWVEFQNKFFKADGHPFSPFKLETVLTKSDSAD
uniref:V-type proton ATPase subunit a n=1 Tax=Chromera velia CCMP2878 TaxID=1169474 RepID=A0A0G4F8R1_9ALVE|eukprot:Cvel_15798.t1-p1 / transcript=Cvel_15798.t1 / gene=Cvel_15798 / organism=Chromera_velia_CCMP2878 / gene_product=V-type proton ATPase 116 kDa subunit a isoform 4, putative / transcript_product=V-type proton ATPase 116 kDa subunit a isoform 4, putative / location=Cvel_scaffold1186:1027-7476(+) / protein_length=586 / sequence_SO=supercontig / SO=protein_coding / is_pseudo=false